jgi:hypothetical protein
VLTISGHSIVKASVAYLRLSLIALLYFELHVVSGKRFPLMP